MLTSASNQGSMEREAMDLKAIRSRIGEISKEIQDGFEPIDSSIVDREKLLEDCASQYREIMERLECQDSIVYDCPEGLDSYLDKLMKEISSVQEEAAKVNLEMDSLMDTISADAQKMENDLEECDYMLKCVDNNGGQSGVLNSGEVSSFQHQEFEILELDRQIEESQWRLKIMKELDSSLKSVDTIAETSSMLSDLKVLEVKDNCIRLFLAGPIVTSDGILMGQKLDLNIERPITSDHELLIEFAEDNMEVKKMEIFPDDVSLNETFEMIKTFSRDFNFADTSFLRHVVRLVQQQIILCTVRHLFIKDASRSRHSFEYSQRDNMATVHLVGGIDAFIQARVNNLEHSRHHLVQFSDAIEEILGQEMQSEV